MEGFKNLLLNILFILLPLFVYQAFWAEKAKSILTHSRHRIALAVMCCVSLILCMTFPIYLIPGYRLDLRTIPMLISFLYGGYSIGFVTTFVMLAFRVYIGGVNAGFYYVLYLLPVNIGVACFFVRRFSDYSRIHKMTMLMLLTIPQLLLTCLFKISGIEIAFWKQPYLLGVVCFTLAYMLSIWGSVNLIENMRERILLRTEIQRAEKLQVLGDLAASIAHEIRNPMTVVRGMLQLQQDHQIPEEKRQTFLQMAIEELDRSETIISNYLSYARPENDRLVKVNVADCIARCVGIFSSLATLHNVELRTTTQPDLLIVADPEKLSQVLINLLKNAIEAMPGGGKVEIAASLKQHEVIILVNDTGVGMAPEQLARIGDPYFSTKKDGTGVGLMICFQIIHSMHGKIAAKSEKGKGTEFAITLPVSAS